MTGATTAAERVEGERDEPPRARATPRRIDETPPPMRHPAGDDEEGIPDASDIHALRSIYNARIAATRLTVPKRERTAAIRAIKAERKAAIRELTARKKSEREAARKTLQKQRVPRPDPPTAK